MFDKIKALLQSMTTKPEMLSPIPKGMTNEQLMAGLKIASPRQVQAEEAPQPQVRGRNPDWSTWERTNPKGFQEISSAAQIAAGKHGVPADLLMDVSGLETSGGTQLGSPKGHTAAGYYMFNDPTLNDPYLPAKVPTGFDKMSATDSADLAAQLIKKKQLGRWAVAKGKGAGGKSLTDFYSPEELALFLK